MRKQDWSLVLFTSLSQLSVGLILCLTMLVCFNRETAVLFETGLGLKNPVLLALLLVGIATTISLLHLGRPSNAPGALNNLPGSWLSREILALGLYSLSLLIFLVQGWIAGNHEYLKFLLPLSTMLGFALLWMMIRIYTVPTIPAWNNWYTPLSFALTAICMGLVTFLALSAVGFVIITDRGFTIFAVILAMILLIEIVSGYIHQRRLEKMNTGIEKLVFNRGLFFRLFLSRMAMLVIALLTTIAIIYFPAFFTNTGVNLLIFMLMTLVYAQEIMGRFLFYSSYFRMGV